MFFLNIKYISFITFQMRILIAAAPCYNDDSGNCIGYCGAGCAECTSATTCTKCNTLYGPSSPGSCLGCSISNCADCLLNYTTCVGCELGYGKTSAGLCAKCSSNCVSCGSNSTMCNACELGYKLTSAGLCKTCSISNCAACDTSYSKCEVCENGYIKTLAGLCKNMIRDAKVIGTKTIRVKKTATFTGKRNFVVNCQNTATSLYTTTIAEAASQHSHATTLNSLTDCPHPFTRVNFTSSCLYLNTTKVTWTTAQYNCNNLRPNSHLVVISSATKQSYVNSYLNSMPANFLQKHCFENIYYLIWTSGQRYNPPTFKEFYWKPYPSNSTWIQFNYTNWQLGEPNNEGGLESVHLINANFEWNDIDSSDFTVEYSSQCYLCEFEL